jgi:hypothetical protein
MAPATEPERCWQTEGRFAIIERFGFLFQQQPFVRPNVIRSTRYFPGTAKQN